MKPLNKLYSEQINKVDALVTKIKALRKLKRSTTYVKDQLKFAQFKAVEIDRQRNVQYNLAHEALEENKLENDLIQR